MNNEETSPAPLGEKAEQGCAVSRRDFMRMTGMGAALAALSTTGCVDMQDILQQHFLKLSPADLKDYLSRLEKEYSLQYGTKVTVEATPAMPDVTFGYGLDLSRCIGCRRCVHACVKENNQSRDPEVQWIRVLRMEKEHGIDLEHADPYYNPEKVPEEGHFYMPVQCQQCTHPPCVKTCPVKATWQEPDGIVVIDYNWCLGCRCCMAACPYGARRLNWGEPTIPSDKLNPQMHALGNRPRVRGCVEKCTFCIQRVRKGLYPACVEICPVGARIFGNLLDPNSDVRRIMDSKEVFVFKKELHTGPRFFYFH